MQKYIISFGGKKGTWIWDGKDEVPKPKTRTIYEEKFLAAIRKLNDEHRQGERVIVPVNNKEVILVYWYKSRWAFEILPILSEE